MIDTRLTAHEIVERGIQGSCDDDDMLQRQSAALRPVELRNKPH